MVTIRPFSKPLILFRVVGGWRLSQCVFSKRWATSWAGWYTYRKTNTLKHTGNVVSYSKKYIKGSSVWHKKCLILNTELLRILDYNMQKTDMLIIL